MATKNLHAFFRAACVVAVISLTACDPLSLTALSVGTSAGVQHTMSGITYRTFSTTLPKVRAAVTTALDRMAIKVDAREKMQNGERIKGRAGDRDIEIELESLSPRLTRMRSMARSGFFMDAATATEVILQTEKVLGGLRGA